MYLTRREMGHSEVDWPEERFYAGYFDGVPVIRIAAPVWGDEVSSGSDYVDEYGTIRRASY